MANTLAHLAVAQKILKARPGLVHNTDSFFLGSIAPDSIESKQGAVRDDKKLVHLRLGITDMEWLEPEKMSIFDKRLKDFVGYFISREQDSDQRDFCMGYLVHLLTDKINHGSMRLRLLHELMPHGFSDGTWDFVYEVLNELEAMDKYLIDSRPETAELFYSLMDKPVRHYLPGMIEKEYLEKSLGWWKKEYIPQISQRRARILVPRDIDVFVDLAAHAILAELEELI